MAPKNGPTGNRLLDTLPETDRQPLLAHLVPVELSIRQKLYEQDSTIEVVYFPVTTVVSMLASVSDGTAVEVATIGNEGLLGIPVFLGVTISPGLAFAQVPGTALRMPTGTFQAVANSGGTLQGLLQRYTFALFRQISQGSACNRLHSVDQRCSRWLLLTHDRTTTDEFPLTHEFLARMLGVRRASVSLTAARLQQAGLIHYHRGIIAILDRQGLEETACECYRVIADEYARMIG